MLPLPKILLLGAAVTSTVANVIVRDTAQLYADLRTIDTDENNLTKAVNAFTGSAAQILAVQGALSQLNNDIKNAVTNANNSPVGTSAQCSQVLDYLANVVEPDLAKTSSALINKKSAFDAAGYKNSVLQALQNLRSNYKSLMDGVCRICKSTSCSAVASKIDQDIVRAINAYGPCEKC